MIVYYLSTINSTEFWSILRVLISTGPLAGVQPRWIQGDSKVGGQSQRLWKNTYLITDLERLEMDSVVGRLVEKRRLNNLDYVE